MSNSVRAIPKHFEANAVKALLMKQLGKEKKEEAVEKEMEKMFSIDKIDVALYEGKFLHIETQFEDVYCKCDRIEKNDKNKIIKIFYIHGFTVEAKKLTELDTKIGITFKEEYMLIPGLLSKAEEITLEEYNNKVSELIDKAKTFLLKPNNNNTENNK